MIAAGYDGQALAEVIKAVAFAIGAIALLALAIGVAWALMHQRKVSASIDSRLGHLELGVNGVTGESDDPPLIDKVRRIERTLDRICDHLAIPSHSQKEAT
jgi:uncharacterized protein YoxC